MENPFDNPERKSFRKIIKQFVDKEVKPFCDKWDEEGEVPWELHQKVGDLGVWGFGIDEKYGGLGFDDCFMRSAFNEEFAKCGAYGVPASMTGRMISVEVINKLASEEIKSRVLPDILCGRKGSSLGVTEPSGGSDVANLKTKAHKDGNHYVINPCKL